MPTSRVVVVAAGAGFTDVRATIPLHRLKVRNMSSVVLEFKVPDDSFSTTRTWPANGVDPIDRKGSGFQGLLGRPPGYNAANTPAQGDLIIQLHAADNSQISVEVTEDESQS